jgi:hypothetical protein
LKSFEPQPVLFERDLSLCRRKGNEDALKFFTKFEFFTRQGRRDPLRSIARPSLRGRPSLRAQAIDPVLPPNYRRKALRVTSAAAI